MNTTTLNIHGMHCDGCATRVKTLLEREPGVREAYVSFAEGVARIMFNPRILGEDRLVEVIEQGGFSVPVQQP